MTSVAFLAPDLTRWDLIDEATAPGALVLPLFSDERPLRGAAGLCDWRLCGRLSRLCAAGRVQGAFGETTLYPPSAGGRRRLPFPKLVLFGLGPSERFDEPHARAAARRILDVVARLGITRCALAPPGRSTGRLSARRALELFLDEAARAQAPAELVVVESTAGQKEAADLARK
jgi:hypothetical protein